MKQIFVLINLILLAAAAYLSVQLLYENAAVGYLSIEKQSADNGQNPDTAVGKVNGTSVDSMRSKITERNVFRVQVTAPAPDSKPPEVTHEIKDVAPTSLALKLWGTVTGPGQVFAVIEDTQKRIQSLYQIGDTIQGAIIREILPHQVIITVDGKSQRLEMETEPLTSVGPVPESQPAVDSEEISVEKSMISQSLQALDEVKKNVKFRPHYSDGELTGFLLYGIQPQSVLDQMGFKNGDILRQVNDTPVLTEDFFTSLFQSLEDSTSKTRVGLARRGAPKEFVFHVTDGSGSIQGQQEPEETIGD